MGRTRRPRPGGPRPHRRPRHRPGHRRPGAAADRLPLQLRRRCQRPCPRTARRTPRAGALGRGQVVDTALADGAALISTLIHQWREVPGNHTVTDAPHYSLYRAADGRHLAVAAIEPRLYRNLLEQLGLADADTGSDAGTDGGPLPDRADPAAWPALRELIAARFASRDRDHWVKLFDAVDAGVAPLLTAAEAAEHHQLASREAFVTIGGTRQAAPPSRFGRTPAATPGRAPLPGEHTEEVLAEWR